MPIESNLLNQLGVITRPDKTYNAIGDSSGTVTIVASNVPCRVARHEAVNKDTFNQAGRIEASSHKIFLNSGVDIQTGDYMTVGGVKYWVNDPNLIPGGVTDHHIEVLCSMTNT